MKRKFQKILRYLPWLLLLFGVDAFFTVLLWIADLDAFYAMSALLLLADVFRNMLCTGTSGRKKRAGIFGFSGESR